MANWLIPQHSPDPDNCEHLNIQGFCYWCCEECNHDQHTCNYCGEYVNHQGNNHDHSPHEHEE